MKEKEKSKYDPPAGEEKNSSESPHHEEQVEQSPTTSKNDDGVTDTNMRIGKKRTIREKWRLTSLPNKIISVATVVIAGASLLQFGSAFFQWLEMHDAGRQTDRIIAADERLAKAMEGSVKEAGDSLSATQLSFRDDQRPWVAIWQSHMSFETQIPLGAQIEIVNVGKTPALRVTEAASRFIWQPPMLSGPPPKLIRELAFHSAAPVPPQGKTTIGLADATKKQPLAADWVSIKNGSQILYNFGEIRYEDTFGRQHSTKFCFYLTNPGTTNVMAFCKGYNDMN